MKDLTIKDIIGYIKAQMSKEEFEVEFYQKAQSHHEEGSAKYEGYNSAMYGHMHTKNELYDIVKLLEKIKGENK